LGLLTTYTHHSEPSVFTELPLSYTLQFTVTHALGFSIFTSRILATDFNTVMYQSHCIIPQNTERKVFFSQTDFEILTALHSIILMPQFLCSQAHILAGWSLETQISSSAPRLISWQAGVSKLRSVPLLPGSYPGRLESRNSDQFLCSQAHILAGCSLETRLSSSAPKLIYWQTGVSKLNCLLAITSQSSSTAVSRDSLKKLFQLAWDPRFIASGRIQQKTPFP
jgi:hypothetical protein